MKQMQKSTELEQMIETIRSEFLVKDEVSNDKIAALKAST
jgi:hypothetical protein